MSSKKLITKVDEKGRITLPKEIREKTGINKGTVLFIDPELGQVKLTRAVEDPIAKLKEYTEKEFISGNTKDLRKYAKEKGIEVNE